MGIQHTPCQRFSGPKPPNCRANMGHHAVLAAQAPRYAAGPMTRALLTAISLLSLLGCGGDDASAPRTIEGSCAEFCEKVEGSGCTDAGMRDTCMQNCREDTAEYPACEDEAKAAMHCFARADVECQDTFGGSFP